jgi:hypothetical protein
VTLGGTMALPVAPGTSYSGTISFPSGSGTATISASAAAPSGATTLDLVGRTSSTHIASGSRLRTATSGAPYTTTAYFTVTATSNVTISGIPTISASGYDGAFYNTQGFWVTLPQSGTITLASGSSVYFAIYTGGTLPPPNQAGCVGVQPDATSRAKTDLVGVQPITAGAAFSYTGTLTSEIVRATPCAIPNVTATAAVTVQVTTSPGSGSDINEDSTETDAYGTETVSTSTDAVVEATSSPAAQSFAELSETTTDEVNDSTVTTYGNPLVYAIAAPLPFSGQITNGPPSTVVGNLADGTKTTRTYASTGAYTETDTIPGGGNNAITVNADGSGTYNIDASSLIFSYAAPAANGSIVLTVNQGGSTSTLTIPAWFTSGEALYSDVTKDTTPTGYPSPCAPTPSTVPTDDFHRVISIIDPVLGYSENETIDAYVVSGTPTVGPACVTINDVQDIYYDYNFDTPYILYASLNSPAAPMQTNTINEAYWYSTAPTGTAGKVRASTESLGGEPGLGASIAAHASGIAFQRTLQRAQRIETFTHNLVLHRSGGLK